MFTDPQTVTINAVANVLPRTASGVNTGAFTKDDGNLKLSISDTYGRRTRRVARIDHKKIVTDPLITATNVNVSSSVYLVIDQPALGYTVTEMKQIVDGLLAYLSASSGAAITKILGGES